MSTETREEFVPNNPNDRQKIRNALEEAVASMLRADAERGLQKQIYADLKESFGMKPKTARRLAKTMYLHNFDEVNAEHDTFNEMYELIVQKAAPAEKSEGEED